uniref:Uncharacterized protein n=1 Tax=Ananas comosus var. bracteatus TaxID=296719 RepID=A0A6V7PY27_ANACO|nr:unnamed protein product [Ananas comosus var. bracteatus]
MMARGGGEEDPRRSRRDRREMRAGIRGRAHMAAWAGRWAIDAPRSQISGRSVADCEFGSYRATCTAGGRLQLSTSNRRALRGYPQLTRIGSYSLSLFSFVGGRSTEAVVSGVLHTRGRRSCPADGLGVRVRIPLTYEILRSELRRNLRVSQADWVTSI